MRRLLAGDSFGPTSSRHSTASDSIKPSGLPPTWASVAARSLQASRATVVDNAVTPSPGCFARRRSFGSVSAVTSFMAHLCRRSTARGEPESYGSPRPRRTADRPSLIVPIGVPAAAPELPTAGQLGPSFISAFCVMRRAAGGSACLASGRPAREACRLSAILVPALRPGFPRPARSAIGIRACRLPAPRAIDTQARTVPPAEDRRHERGLVEECWNA